MSGAAVLVLREGAHERRRLRLGAFLLALYASPPVPGKKGACMPAGSMRAPNTTFILGLLSDA